MRSQQTILNIYNMNRLKINAEYVTDELFYTVYVEETPKNYRMIARTEYVGSAEQIALEMSDIIDYKDKKVWVCEFDHDTEGNYYDYDVRGYCLNGKIYYTE